MPTLGYVHWIRLPSDGAERTTRIELQANFGASVLEEPEIMQKLDRLKIVTDGTVNSVLPNGGDGVRLTVFKRTEIMGDSGDDAEKAFINELTLALGVPLKPCGYGHADHRFR